MPLTRSVKGSESRLPSAAQTRWVWASGAARTRQDMPGKIAGYESALEREKLAGAFKNRII